MRTRWLLLVSSLLTACADETVTPPTEDATDKPDLGGFGDAPEETSLLDGGDAAPDTAIGDTSVVDSAIPDIAVDTPSIDAGEGPTVMVGATNRFRILGTIVTPTTILRGEILVKDQKIVCVDVSCATHADAAGATVIDTKGIVFPGLIDAHNHILYNVFDESDWSTPGTLYNDSNAWQGVASYKKFKTDKYNPMVGSTASGGGDLDCEMNKYGEIKALVAGTTSMVGHNGAANCYESVIRTLGSNDSDFGVDDGVSTNTLGVGSLPAPDAGSFVAAGSYVIHVAEGKPGSSIFSEFATLESKGFLTSKTVIVHGTALGAPEFKKMAAAGSKLVWSPKSNVGLYGTTTDIPAARAAGVDIALAPDWSLSGSVNLLDELRYASAWDKAKWGGILSAKELVEMVTTKPAKMLAIDKWVGSIEVGKYADLMVIGGDAAKPYDALLAVTPRDVRMTMINGKILFGDEVLQKAAPTTPCEGLPVCGRPKFICVAEAASGTVKKLDQTLTMIETALSSYMFTPDGGAATKPAVPLAPLTTCP